MPGHVVPRALRGEPFTAARGTALVGRRALAGAAYRRVIHGTYVSADAVLDHGQVLRAARLRLGPGPVLVGISAAWALGCRMAEPDDPAHLMVHSGVARQALLVPHRGAVDSSALVFTPFGACMSPARTAVDLARGFAGTGSTPFDRRVAWVDALLRATTLTAQLTREAVTGSTDLTGLSTARRVIRLARDQVDSPKETELRLLLRRHGFPEPVVQCVVRSAAGYIVARLDLGWPQYLLGVEYDGIVHREFHQHSRDLARHNRLRAAGWTVLQVDARSLRDPRELLGYLWAMLSDAGPGVSLAHRAGLAGSPHDS